MAVQTKSKPAAKKTTTTKSSTKMGIQTAQIVAFARGERVYEAEATQAQTLKFLGQIPKLVSTWGPGKVKLTVDMEIRAVAKTK
jgi:hypothetical protein